MTDKTDSPDSNVHPITIWYMCRHVASNLKGSLSVLKKGTNICLKSMQRDKHVSITIERSETIENTCNIVIDSSRLMAKGVNTRIAMIAIHHLYVTWDTPHLVSLCVVQNGRFNLVNVFANTSVEFLNGVDKRSDETEEVNSAGRQNRRTFFVLDISSLTSGELQD